MAEQVIDLLEPVEVEADHREAALMAPGENELFLEPPAVAGAVGEPGQRVVVRQVPDVAFRLLAGRQIAHRDGLVPFAAVVDFAQDGFHRHRHAASGLEFPLERYIGPLGQRGAQSRLEEVGKRPPREVDAGRPNEIEEAGIGGHDDVVVADDQALDRGIGKAAHAIRLQFRTPALAGIEVEPAEGEQEDEKRAAGHEVGQFLGRGVGFADDLEAVLEACRAHAGEVHQHDAQSQERGPANAGAPGVRSGAEEHGEGAERHADKHGG